MKSNKNLHPEAVLPITRYYYYQFLPKILETVIVILHYFSRLANFFNLQCVLKLLSMLVHFCIKFIYIWLCTWICKYVLIRSALIFLCLEAPGTLALAPIWCGFSCYAVTHLFTQKYSGKKQQTSIISKSLLCQHFTDLYGQSESNEMLFM